MTMTDTPPRRTLSLKATPPSFKSMLKPQDWKCRPCGTVLQVLAEIGDDDYVRCPSCNARLGLAKDFRSRPPNVERLRARMVKGK
jgi:DNA-directed RNA polymerase subunit RPC12/RpoP